MSEASGQPNPEQAPSPLEVQSQQQADIRGMVDARVSGDPLPDTDRTFEDYGLDSAAFDAHKDTVLTDSTFVKFVSKENPSVTIDGFTHVYVGGNIARPDYHIDKWALQPDGTIVRRVYSEGGSGRNENTYTDSPDSPDPADREKYERMLRFMYQEAQQIEAAKARKEAAADAQGSDNTEQDAGLRQRPTEETARKVGRFSLRRRRQ